MIAQATDWAALTALSTAATAAILLAASVVGYFQLREARRLREARFRPFVVLDFDVSSSPPFILITIANLGPVMAREVRFTFEPDLASSFDDRSEDTQVPPISELGVFREGLASLAPGKRIEVLFDSWIRRGDRPDAYSVKVRYKGERRQPYEDEIRLDLAPFRHLRWIDRRDLDDIHRRLVEIVGEMRRWSAPGGGVKVRSPRDIREEQAEWEHGSTGEPPGGSTGQGGEGT